MAAKKAGSKRKGRKATPAKATTPKKKASKGKVKVPSPGDYLREIRADKDVDDTDFALMSDELAFHHPVTEWVSTGVLAIDRLTGGGWPVGRISELAAWEGVGKSTLLDQSLAMAQRAGAVTVLTDTEQARDTGYTQRLGVDTDKLIVARVSSLEDGFLKLEKLVDLQEQHARTLRPQGKDVPLMFIVWDSVGGTPSQAELDGNADDNHVGVAARRFKMNMRRLAMRVSELRIALVFSNHFYTKIGGMGGLATYGGSGIRYFTSLRVWLTRKGGLKVGTDEVGHIVLAKIKKTRMGSPADPVECALIYGAGFDNAYTLWEWGKSGGGPIEQRGAWTNVTRADGTSTKFQRSFLGLGQLLSEEPELYAQLAESYATQGTQG